MLESVCNVPVSGESREIKNWPLAFLVEAQRWVNHLVAARGRLCLHTDPAIQLISRLLERHQTLVIPVLPLKAFWLNHTEMSCYFSHLSELSGRGETIESLKLGFLLHPMETLVLLWAIHQVQKCLRVVYSQTSSQPGMLVRDFWPDWQGKDHHEEASIVLPTRTESFGMTNILFMFIT